MVCIALLPPAWSSPCTARASDTARLTDLRARFLEDPYLFNTTTLPPSPNFFQSLLSIYQRRPRHALCQFTPSCSRYAYIAFALKSSPSAVVASFERFYRCNTSAWKRYPVWKGFLLDPPEGFLADEPSAVGCPAALTPKRDFGLWLLQNGEWQAAHNYYLVGRFQESTHESRVGLALSLLRLNRPREAQRWLQPDSSTSETLLLAHACRRTGDSERALNMGLRLERSARESWLRKCGASVALAAALDIGTEAAADSVRSTLAVLFDEEELPAFTAQLEHVCGSTPGWLSALASALLPGSGQAINGYVADGITALTACTFLGWATAAAFRDGNTPGGLFFGGLFLFGYTANVHAARTAPAVRREQLRSRLRDLIESRCDPVLEALRAFEGG